MNGKFRAIRPILLDLDNQGANKLLLFGIPFSWGVAGGVVDKNPVCLPLEILSWLLFLAPLNKLLQAAVWRKRDYNEACISCQRQLAIPSPPTKKQQLATLIVSYTNLTNTLNYQQTNQLVGRLMWDRLPITLQCMLHKNSMPDQNYESDYVDWLQS